MKKLLSVGLFLTICGQALAAPSIKIGVPTVLSGDFANLGQNIVRTIETYKKHRLRHPLEFVFEDARISSQDGLKAYQSLINVSRVDVLIGATSSNATVAAARLINDSHTVMLSPVTGGTSVDRAGEYIFRIANSDVLSGIGAAQDMEARSVDSVALLTEQTEHTEDLIDAFKRTYKGRIVFDEVFAPGVTDFKTPLTRMKRANPKAIFIATQTGVPLALSLQQLKVLGGFPGEIHTTFVSAINADARKMAGDLMKGVHYMAPSLDESNPLLKAFFTDYETDHKQRPDIPFHTASTVDALDLLQNYFDRGKTFSREGFKDYLLTVKNYSGLMGTYSIDDEGNSDLGFRAARIE